MEISIFLLIPSVLISGLEKGKTSSQEMKEIFQIANQLFAVVCVLSFRVAEQRLHIRYDFP